MPIPEISSFPPEPADPALRYARQTRNAVVTFATIAVTGVLGSIIIIGIVVAVSIAHQNAVLDGGSPSVSSTCASQGGWDPTC